MELTQQRGAIPLTLDRPRVVFFDMKATWLLIQQYGVNFVRELYGVTKSNDLTLKSPEALAFFLWAGLQADAKNAGEDLTLEAVAAQIGPWNIAAIFNGLVLALTGAMATPAQPGKGPAAGDAAKPAARINPVPRTPGATLASTSMKRSGSPMRSSGGRRSSSGR